MEQFTLSHPLLFLRNFQQQSNIHIFQLHIILCQTTSLQPSASLTMSKPATSSPMTSHKTTDSPSLVYLASSPSTSIEIEDPPVTPTPTSCNRGRQRSWPPTQEPTFLPTYWPGILHLLLQSSNA